MADCTEFRFNESASTSEEKCDVLKDSTKYQRQPLEESIKVLDGSCRYEMKENIINPQVLYHLNLKQEGDVFEVHNNFLKAGANIIRTNTTYAFFYEMGKYYSYYTEMKNYEKMIRKAVEIANSAVFEYNKKSNLSWNQATVVGSCGHFKPISNMAREDIKCEYKVLMKTLLDANVNTFCLQDIKSSDQADMLIELLKELQKEGTSALMMFKPNRKGFLNDGMDWMEVAVHCYDEFPLIAVGIDCLYPKTVLKLLKKFKERPDLQKQIPLVVCTDKDALYKEWKPVHQPENCKISPAIQWAELGIKYIGGCCGVGAEDIKHIREELNKINDTPQ